MEFRINVDLFSVLSVLKYAAESATNAFSSKLKYENLAVVGSVIEKNLEIGRFTLLISSGRKKIDQEL